jgi:hypothetical protein
MALGPREAAGLAGLKEPQGGRNQARLIDRLAPGQEKARRLAEIGTIESHFGYGCNLPPTPFYVNKII